MNQGNITYSQNVNLGAELVQNSEPKEQVEVFVSLLDTNTRSDLRYFLKLGLITKQSKQENIIGQTNDIPGGEKLMDFDRSFVFDYYFETKQSIQVYVFQTNNQCIASVTTTVGKLMGSKGQNVTLELNDRGFSGKIKLQGQPVKSSDMHLKLDISIDFGQLGVQPYFIVKRNSAQQGFNWIKAYKSEVLTTYPNNNKYVQVNLSTQFLCNSDLDNRPILIEFYDLKTNQVLGGFCAPVNKILQIPRANLVDPTGKQIQGRIIGIGSRFSKKYKFLDYIRGGAQVSLVVGIDFTGSNGDPKSNTSLHSINKQPNLYEQAIDSCCTTVAFYDYDQQFPVFGYGAIVDRQLNKVNHCFPLNLTNNPDIFTVKGILDTYRKFLSGVKLYGPTCFAPLLRRCSQIVQENQQKNLDIYTILMILTDGIINDMGDTIDIIVEMSKLPVSIIIIGIGPGGEDGFKEMEVLDSDDEPLLNSRREKCVRDIVQFVEFNRYGNNPVVLAEKVLEEVPRQVENYYHLLNKPPGDPIVEINPPELLQTQNNQNTQNTQNTQINSNIQTNQFNPNQQNPQVIPQNNQNNQDSSQKTTNMQNMNMFMRNQVNQQINNNQNMFPNQNQTNQTNQNQQYNPNLQNNQYNPNMQTQVNQGMNQVYQNPNVMYNNQPTQNIQNPNMSGQGQLNQNQGQGR